MATAMKRTTAKNVDEYISSFPPKVQAMLKKIRQTVKKTAPKAEEMISYGIAGYKYNGMLIYFAGYTNHVSVYPAPRMAETFKKELAGYKGGKGTVQFPLDKQLPLDLIKRVVQFRVKANEEKAAKKQQSKN
ncbi:MAG: iron chaperone [Bacteroidota bacterium]